MNDENTGLLLIALLFAIAMTTMFYGTWREFRRKPGPPRQPRPVSAERQAEIDAQRQQIRRIK